MDNIYDTLAKLNKVANAPEIVKEDNQAMMKKGLEDLMKKTKLNKQADYTAIWQRRQTEYETGLPKMLKKTQKCLKKSQTLKEMIVQKQAGREVAHDAKYDGMKHAGKDGCQEVTKDIKYDEKHDKDGMS